MIPLKYNLRNLRVRWTSTVMTVLGTGMVVWSSCISFGLADGLRHSLRVSGDPLDLIVLRKGATNEINGGFYLEIAEELRTLEGVARDKEGRPLVSLELLNTPLISRRDGSRATVMVRGVEAVSAGLRPSFQIESGRMLEAGRGECLVSRAMTGRFLGSRLGETLKVGENESYRVVGVFSAGGSAAESEIWVDRKDLERNTGREGSVSCVQIRAGSVGGREKLVAAIEGETRFKLQAIREVDYYASQARSGGFLTFSGILIAGLLTLGAMFAAANTMYAAVSARGREIGTLRAIGFSRSSILLSFLFESILICSVGGFLGLLATLPLGSLAFGTINSATLSEVTIGFRFGPPVMVVAFLTTLAMGTFGGLFPALRAIRLDVVRALRAL